MRARPSALPGRLPASLALALAIALPFASSGCDDGGDDASEDGAGGAAEAGVGGQDGGAPSGAVDGGPDLGDVPPLTLRAVSGDLTFFEAPAAGQPGHLIAALSDGSGRQRLTSDAAHWRAHAVSPDRAFIAAVRAESEAGPGEVWMLDVREGRSWALSPEGCDAGIGGVGWRDQNRLLFAMQCPGADRSSVFLANASDESRAAAGMLEVLRAEHPIRDVFPAPGTSLFAYVLDAPHERRMGSGPAFVKPQVWVADADIDHTCRVTDGDPAFEGTETITGDAVRLGDHEPAFTSNLTAILFSRNVGGKGNGPGGHRDIFRIALNRDVFNPEAETCFDDGTLEQLTGAQVDETFMLPDGSNAPADERYPAVPVQMTGTVGALMFTAQLHPGGSTLSQVVVTDFAGSRGSISTPGAYGDFARWVVTNYDTTGVR
jgi:hypothetical protein